MRHHERKNGARIFGEVGRLRGVRGVAFGMGTAEENDVGGSTLDRKLTQVLSELDQVRLKLDRLREDAQRHNSERRLKLGKVPPTRE